MHKLSPQYFSSCQFPATFLGQSNNYKLKIITFLLYFLRKLFTYNFSHLFFSSFQMYLYILSHYPSIVWLFFSLIFTISIYEHVYTHVLQNINWSVCIVLLIYLSLGLRIWYCNINWCVPSWGRPILLHQVFLNYIHIFVQVEASPDFPNQFWHVHWCCLLM